MKNSMKNSTGTETLSGVPAMSLLQKQQSTRTSPSSSSSSGIAVLYHCWSLCKQFGKFLVRLRKARASILEARRHHIRRCIKLGSGLGGSRG